MPHVVDYVEGFHGGLKVTEGSVDKAEGSYSAHGLGDSLKNLLAAKADTIEDGDLNGEEAMSAVKDAYKKIYDKAGPTLTANALILGRMQEAFSSKAHERVRVATASDKIISKQLREIMTRGGWMMAGQWYSIMARYTDLSNVAMSQLKDMTKGRADSAYDICDDDLLGVHGVFGCYWVGR